MNEDFLIIILFGIMSKSKDNQSFGINNMDLDSKYTIEKIKMMKEIGPYFPEGYHHLINKSISFTNKFIKINEAMDFINKDHKPYILEHIPMDSKERGNKIMSIIQKQPLNFKKGKMGQIIDLISNMDKYQKMFGVLNKVMDNPNSLNDPSQLINLVSPLIDGQMEDNSSKIKEISKMMELMKLLDTPKKETNTK